MKTYLKFGSLIVAILGIILMLALKGIGETKTYYKTISELNELGDKAKEHRIRVGGDVSDSITRHGREVRFTLTQETEDKRKMTLPVVYSGIEPLPDTFKAGAQALADGKLGPDGVFHATSIQAKCASKYEAKPVVVAPAAAGPRAAL